MDNRKRSHYSNEALKSAIQELKNGVPCRAAARKYGIPRVTLMRKFQNHSETKERPGPPTKFNADQETMLVNWIKYMAKTGFPVSKETLMFSVDKLAREYNVNFHKGTMPGRKWYEGFLKRHPDISKRTSQNLTVQRRCVTQQQIDAWFEEVGSYIKEKKLEDVFKNPNRIFNADETAFFLNPKPGKVLAVKGSKTVYTTAGGDEKQNLTVLLTANSEGELAPPMIVYRYVRIPQSIANVMPPEWAIGRSDNGWMTQETFYEYITNIFEPWLTKKQIQRPVVFFLDGHTSHISLPLSKFCVAKQIELIALLPNATHLLQPMDVAVFHTLKASWRQKVAEWRMDNNGKQVEKHDFPLALRKVLDTLKQDTIRHGFKACGLVPWNPTEVKVPGTQTTVSQTATRSKSDVEKFLRMLEERIGVDKLALFKATEIHWEGPTEDVSLFSIWANAKYELNTEQPSTPVSIIILILKLLTSSCND